MYNTLSQSTIDMIEGDCRCFRALMDFGDFQITSDKIYKIQTDGASCSDEDVTIGGIYSQGVTIEVSEIPCPLEGRVFMLYFYLIDLSFVTPVSSDVDNPLTHYILSEYTHEELGKYTHEGLSKLVNMPHRHIPMGQFRVSKCKSKANGYTISAGDFLEEADKEYNSDLVYPASTKDIEKEICNNLGIDNVTNSDLQYMTSDKEVYMTSDSGDYILYDYVVFIDEPPAKTTMRQMLGYIASLRGCFAVANRLGNLKYAWYEDSGLILQPNRIDTPELSEKDITITRIACQVSENKTLYSGQIGRTMEISNPYMTQRMLNVIAADILPFKYRPASVLQRMGDPRIDVWDILHLGDCIIPVMDLTYSFDGGLSADIEASGKTDAESNL